MAKFAPKKVADPVTDQNFQVLAQILNALLTATPTGSLISSNVVTNYQLAQVAAKTLKGNALTTQATPTDLTIPQVAALFTAPTRTVLTSGTAQTFTTPANATRLVVRMVGGGGGGCGSGAGLGGGTAGNASSFGTLTANGGGAGAGGGVGGTASGGDINITGSAGFGGGGSGPAGTVGIYGGVGGSSAFGGGGNGGNNGPSGGGAGATNSGGGGGGAGGSASVQAGGGGGSGGYCEKVIFPTALQTFTYTVGATAAGGAAGTSGAAGGAGAAGLIVIDIFYT